MKKAKFLISSLIILLINSVSLAQDLSVKVHVVKNITITAAERDSYVVPVTEAWYITLDTGEKQKNVGGAGWVPDDSGGSPDQTLSFSSPNLTLTKLVGSDVVDISAIDTKNSQSETAANALAEWPNLDTNSLDDARLDNNNIFTATQNTFNSSVVLQAQNDGANNNLTLKGASDFVRLFIDYNGNGSGFSNLDMTSTDILYNGQSLTAADMTTSTIQLVTALKTFQLDVETPTVAFWNTIAGESMAIQMSAKNPGGTQIGYLSGVWSDGTTNRWLWSRTGAALSTANSWAMQLNRDTGDLTIDGTFIGDGSGLTNLPTGGNDGLGPDGDKGDVTVGGTGTTLTINADAIVESKIADNAVQEEHLNASNLGTTGQVLSKSATAGEFTWIDNGAGSDSGSAYFAINHGGAGTQITYSNSNITEGGVGTNRKVWNNHSANDTILLDQSLQTYHPAFSQLESPADSLYFKKGAGVNFFVQGSKTALVGDGFIVKDAVPTYFMYKSTTDVYLQGGTFTAYTEPVGNPELLTLNNALSFTPNETTDVNGGATGLSCVGCTASLNSDAGGNGLYGINIAGTDGSSDRLRQDMSNLPNSTRIEIKFQAKETGGGDFDFLQISQVGHTIVSVTPATSTADGTWKDFTVVTDTDGATATRTIGFQQKSATGDVSIRDVSVKVQ